MGSRVVLLAAVAGLAQPAWSAPAPSEEGERGTPVQTDVQVSRRVQTLLEAPYLKPAELTALRVKHGAWSSEDLASIENRSRAAVIAGVWDDASLLDENADVLDRAEAALKRGELDLALELAGASEDRPARAGWIVAQSLYERGSLEAAAETALALTRELVAGTFREGDEIAHAVRAANLLIGIQGPAGGAADFQGMLGLLSRARDADRSSWMVPLVEAEILSARAARTEAQAAIMEALSLNPRLARAWRLLAEMQVDTFGFDQARQIQVELDNATRSVTGSEDASIEGSLAVARARLRLTDADGAEEILAPVLERLPLSRDALALHAASSARGFDFDETERRVAAFAKLSPGSALAVHAVGATLSDARQYKQASDFFNRAVELEPNNAAAWTDLGLLEMQWGRDVEAADALAQATLRDPFHMRADNSLRLVTELLTYDTIETPNFILRYKPGEDAVLAREMPELLEKMHARVTGNDPGGIDHEPSEKTLIELMPDHARFSVRITGMPQIWTVAAATGRVVAMEAPKDGPGASIGPYDWFRVMQHEYTHTVTLSRTNNRIPHWFTEAAAVHLEDAPRDEGRARMLAKALQDKLNPNAETPGLFELEEINLGFIRPSGPQSRPLAYAQGHWMYEHLIEVYGPRIPLELMDRYAEGATEAEAFADVLGVNPDVFFATFIEWAKRDVISWGLALPDDVPDIETLRVRSAAQAAQGDKDNADGGVLNMLKGDADVALDAEPVEVTEDWIALQLEEFPDHPQLLERMVGYALNGNGGVANASMIPLLERYAAAVPVAQTPHRLLAELYLAGRGAIVGADESAAIPHLEFLDARESYSAAWAIELARRYADLGRWDESSGKAERAVRIAPYEPEYREFAARVAIRTQNWDDAERHLAALVDLEPLVEKHNTRLERLRQLRAKQG